MDFYNIAKSYENAFLSDLRTLIEIESVRDDTTAKKGHPFGIGLKKALDAFLQFGKRDGFEVTDYDGYAGVIAFNPDEAGKESVGALGHLDTVPIGANWTKDPLHLTEKDGYLFGRGVLDDKGPLLAAYYAMKIIRDYDLPIRRKLMIIAGTDEESGMECMDYYVRHGEIPTLSFSPDALFPVIHAEKGRILLELSSKDSTVITDIKGGIRPNVVIPTVWVTLKSPELHQELFDFYLKTNRLQGSAKKSGDEIHLYMEGREAHAAIPFFGNNAALHLLNYIGQAYNDVLAQDLYSLLWDWKGTPERLYVNGNYMGYLTLNTGKIEMKDSEISVVLDIRYPNEKTRDEILNAFENAVRSKQSNIKVREILNKNPLFIHPDTELIKTLMASYSTYTGDFLSKPLAIGGGTYAKKLPNCVGFGPKFPGEKRETEDFVGGCHARDEGMKKESLLKSIAIYADALYKLSS